MFVAPLERSRKLGRSFDRVEIMSGLKPVALPINLSDASSISWIVLIHEGHELS